jgi:hypothetical protein
MTGPAAPDLPDDLLTALRSPDVPCPQEGPAFEQLYAWVMAPPLGRTSFSPGSVLLSDQYLWSGLVDEPSPVPTTTAA